MPDLSRARAPGLVRRLATMTYDLILLSSVLFMAAALFVLPLLWLTADEPGSSLSPLTGLPMLALQLYLLAVIVLYYVYFWTGGRQTLGMRAWRTLVLRADGEPLSALDALRRLAFAALTLAPAGLGLWWMLFDHDGLTWYDRLSHTRAVLTAKPGHAKQAEEA
jgi:uncharacterized RDD family membrane protein YckC